MLLKTTIRFFFFLLLFGSISRLNAQDYLPAVLVFQSGTQETGTVFYSKWGDTPQSFRFKKKDGTVQNVNRTQLKSIEFTRLDGLKERYVCAIVPVNRSPYALSALDADPAPRMQLDTVYLQVLIQAETSFFKLQQNNQLHLFIGSDSIRPLIYKRFVKDGVSSNKFMENNRFRQQLLALTIDCPQLQQRILKLSYNEKPIHKLLMDYLLCKKIETNFLFKPEHIRPQIYVAAGIQYASPNLIGFDGFYFFTYPSTVNWVPTIAGGLNLPIPYSKGGLWFVNELGLRKIDAQVNYSNRNGIWDWDLQATHLRLHSMVRWNILKKERLFIQVGISNGFLLANNSTEVKSILGQTPVIQTVKIRSYQAGYAGGIGGTYKRFTLEARYDQNNSLNPGTSFRFSGSNVKTFGLTLGYRIL